MKVYHIQQFQCNLCSQWFNSTNRLPLKLNCGHNVCKYCIDQNNYVNNLVKIVCPQDFQLSIYRSINDIEIDIVTKSILERIDGQKIMKKNNSKLQTICDYQRIFQDLASKLNKQIYKINECIDQIYKNQIMRIQSIWSKVKVDINRPLKMMQDWKQLVKNYLLNVRKNTQKGMYDFPHFEYYLSQAKKVHQQVCNFIEFDKQNLIVKIKNNKKLCFQDSFQFFNPQKYKQKANDKKQIKKRYNQNDNKNQYLINNQNQQKFYYNIQNKDKYSPQYHTTKLSHQNNYIHKKDSYTIQLQEHNQQNKQNNINKNKKNIYMEDFNRKIGNQTRFVNNTPSPPQERVLTASNFTNITNLRGSFNDKNNNTDTNYKPECNDDKTAICQMFELCKGNNSQIQITKTCPNQNLQNKNNQSDKLLSLMIDNSNQVLNEIQQLNEQMLLSAYQSGLQQDTFEKSVDNQNESIQLRNKISRIITKPYQLLNFYKVKEQKKQKQKQNPNPAYQIKKRNIYDCQIQKYNYTLKMRIIKVQQAINHTNLGQNFIQLINYSLTNVDFRCYLQLQNWTSKIQIVKLVKTNLQDQQLNILLNFVLKVPSLHTLVVSNNQLSEDSIDILLQFFGVNKQLKNIYLSRNHINHLKCKNKISTLKSYGINIYI